MSDNSIDINTNPEFSGVQGNGSQPTPSQPRPEDSVAPSRLSHEAMRTRVLVREWLQAVCSDQKSWDRFVRNELKQTRVEAETEAQLSALKRRWDSLRDAFQQELRRIKGLGTSTVTAPSEVAAPRSVCQRRGDSRESHLFIQAHYERPVTTAAEKEAASKEDWRAGACWLQLDKNDNGSQKLAA